MATTKKIGFLVLVILATSIYVMMPNEVKISVSGTSTSFYTYNGSWVISGVEYSKLYQGTSSVLAASRKVTENTVGNSTTITREVLFSNGAKVKDIYKFDGNIKDKELFPISHEIEIINGTGLIYQYEAQKLEYLGGNLDLLGKEEYNFGKNMTLTWDIRAYYAKLSKISTGGKVTLKYKINSSYEKINIRLFDPIYTKDKFMPELIMNEADIDGGIAIFKVCNPTSFNIPYNEKYVDFLFNKVKGNFDSFSKFYSVNYNTTESNSVWIPNVTIKEITDTNGTKYNLTTDNGKYNITSSVVEKTMYVQFNSTIYYLKPKECKNVMLKATWKPEAVYKTGISIDWLPRINISGVSYIQDNFAWWNITFGKCRQIDIVGTGTALTNYQVSRNITYDSDMQADFDDIRFTNGTCSGAGTELNYWIENKVDSSWANVWIKVPSIAASGNTTLAMYYNASVASASNIQATAYNGIGDDFNDASFNSTLWNLCDTTCPTESGGTLNAVGITTGAGSSGTGIRGVAIRESVNFTSKSMSNSNRHFGFATSLGNAPFEILAVRPTATSLKAWSYGSGSCEVATPASVSNNFKTYEIRRIIASTNYTLYYENSTLLKNETTSTCISSGAFNIVPADTYNIDSSPEVHVDWIFARKIVDPEPTLTVNAEESCFQTGNPCGLVNSIYLNGTNSDRYYELGDQINITATVNDTGGTGQLCLTIDHPGYGTNYSCLSSSSNNINISIIPSLNSFNDSTTSKNLSVDGTTYINMNNKSAYYSSGSITLTGYQSSGVHPFNLSIDIGNDSVLDYWLVNSFLNGTYGWTDRFSGNIKTTNLTLNSNIRNTTRVDLPCGVTINSFTFNITGGNGSIVHNYIDTTQSQTYKSFNFLTANSPQSFTFVLPKNSLISNATFNINGSTSYDSSTSLSTTGSAGINDCNTGGTIDGVSNYYNGTVSLWASMHALSAEPVGTMTIYLKETSTGNTKASCTTTAGPTYAGANFERSCTANIGSTLLPPTTLYAVGAFAGSCSRAAADSSKALGTFTDLPQYVTVNATNITVYFNTSSQYQEYNYSLALNTSVGNKLVALNLSNMQNIISSCSDSTCTVNYYLNSVNSKGTVNIHSVNITYINQISNITLDIGNDGINDYYGAGSTFDNTNITFNSTMINAVNNLLSGTCSNYSLALGWDSESNGNMTENALSINYSINNPISLNSTPIFNYASTRNGNVDVPFVIRADNWGIAELSSMSIPFYGDANYTITANYTDGTTVSSTDSKNISIIWSNYNLSYPTGVSYFQFFPKTVNSTNVTPYGQSSTIPFFNITGRQRDRNFDLYMRVNQSYPSTINLTVSNSSTKGTIILNTSWQKVINNLSVGSSNGNWFWADFFNVNNTALRYIRFFTETMSKCDLC